MKIKEIEYLLPPQDLVYDCLDVFVTLDNDYCTKYESHYVLEVTTPEWLTSFMQRQKSDFVEPGYPYVIVSKLTDDIIKRAVESYINEKSDSYWLKLYHVTVILKIYDLNEILYRKKRQEMELKEILDAEYGDDDLN